MKNAAFKASLVAAVLGVAFLPQPAGAVTDSAFTYTTAKTGYLAFSTMDFQPDGEFTQASAWLNSWTGNTLTGMGCFNTGVHLPQGAKIVSLRVMYAKGLDAYLVSTERETGNSINISTISRNNPNTTRVGFTDTLPTAYVVDNNKYQLGLGICVDPDEAFNGARIQYTYTNAGD